MTADTWSILLIFFLGVHKFHKLRHRRNHAATKPHSISLELMTDHIDINGLCFSVADSFALANAFVDNTFHITLQTAAEIFEKSATATENNILYLMSYQRTLFPYIVEVAASIHRTCLHSLINQLRQRHSEC